MRPDLTSIGRFIARLAMLVAGVSFCFLSGCNSTPDDTDENPELMLSNYQAKIPVGTSVRNARAIMEADGFVVTETQQAKWKGKNGFTYLRCIRDDGIVIKRRWEFALMHNGQFITAVEVRPGLVYP